MPYLPEPKGEGIACRDKGVQGVQGVRVVFGAVIGKFFLRVVFLIVGGLKMGIYMETHVIIGPFPHNA